VRDDHELFTACNKHVGTVVVGGNRRQPTNAPSADLSPTRKLSRCYRATWSSDS